METTKKAGTLVIELKPPYRILECDRDFLKIVGYSTEELKKRVHFLGDIVAKDDYQDFLAAVTYQLKHSSYTSDRLGMINGRGRRIQVLVNGQAFLTKEGRNVLKCSCIEVTTLDTVTLAAEQEISDLDVFSQSVRCGLSKHICDNALTVIWANDYFYTLFGYTREDYIKENGETLISMIYPEDLSLVVNSVTALLEEHEIDITFRIRHKEKTFRWVNLVAASIVDDVENGFPVANFVINDVTNLKYAEMRAGLEAKKYEIIADISEEIPFEYEILTDTITYAKKYETIFGRKSIIRHPEQKFLDEGYISEETMDAFCGLFQAAREGTMVYGTEYQLKTIKDDYEWYYATFSLIKDDSGNPYRAVGIIRNIHQQKKEQEMLLHKAQSDSMTGLLNKATTESYIKDNLKNLQPGTFGVLMLVDIDDFKNVNDTFGHLTGDEVIIEIANVLMRYYFSDGIVGRIGGDEFVVYMNNVLDTAIACEKSENVMEALRKKYPGGNGKPKVTLSIGIAATSEAIPYSDFLEQADAAVYQAKLNGKNGYFLSDGAMERGEYHNERNKNMNDYDTTVISNIIHMLCENTDVSESIKHAIKYAGTSLLIDRIVIWEYQDNRSFLRKTVDWNSETSFVPEEDTNDYRAIFWEEIDSLSITGSYHSVNPSEVKLTNFSKTPFYDSNEFMQGKMEYGDTAIAYIGYFNYSASKMWTSTQIETLNLFTKMLMGYLQRGVLEPQN